MALSGKAASWWKTVLGALVVAFGVSAAVVTVVARRAGDWELAKLGAIASLLFAALIILFVVPPLVRSARAEAARLNLPVQLTAGGIIFAGVYSVVAFAAWNTGNNLLFLIFSILTSTLFVAWSAARVSLRDLAVSARFPDHIYAGDPAPVIVTVHNAKRVLPSFSVVVEARAESGDSSRRRRSLWKRDAEQRRTLAYFMYVPRSSRVEQRVEQTFARRGRVVVKGFEISTRFPFGLFRLRRRLRARDVEIVVYPKPERAGDELHLLPMDAGRVQAARKGAGHDLHSLREYQARDDMRHIDWKASARQRRLIVREFTAEHERRVHVALDTHVDDDERADARFERGVTLAASLVSHFTEERAEVRLTVGGERGEFGTGREHMHACLRRLALAESRLAPDEALSEGERWRGLAPAAPDGYVILLTAAPPGSIPENLWRKSHVIHL